jgi:hypothetical protein
VQSEQAAKPVQVKAIEPVVVAIEPIAATIEPETFEAICEQCGWSHNHYATQRAATNALTAHGKVHK